MRYAWFFSHHVGSGHFTPLLHCRLQEFVKLMGNELSSSADFNLPEFYFRVYRQEEGNSGKFFSHIERVPWEDM
jgi:hypothetical protein